MSEVQSGRHSWTLPCTECDFYVLVFIDSGTGEAAANEMTWHVERSHPGVDPKKVLAQKDIAEGVKKWPLYRPTS